MFKKHKKQKELFVSLRTNGHICKVAENEIVKDDDGVKYIHVIYSPTNGSTQDTLVPCDTLSTCVILEVEYKDKTTNKTCKKYVKARANEGLVSNGKYYKKSQTGMLFEVQSVKQVYQIK